MVITTGLFSPLNTNNQQIRLSTISIALSPGRKLELGLTRYLSRLDSAWHTPAQRSGASRVPVTIHPTLRT